MTKPRRAHLTAAADTALVARHEGAGLPDLDAEARRLHAEWTHWKSRLADHRAGTARDRQHVTTLREQFVAAQVEGDPARAASVQAALTELVARLGSADAVEQGLSEKARATGLVWSQAWHRWHAALEQEMLGHLPARRARLEQDEAAARAAFQRVAAEMPA